jgi:hypothetical protein
VRDSGARAREFHGICDAHGVRLDLRANGFVFTHRRSLVRVKASSIDRKLGKPALEARLGTFVAGTERKTRVREKTAVYASRYFAAMGRISGPARNLGSSYVVIAFSARSRCSGTFDAGPTRIHLWATWE